VQELTPHQQMQIELEQKRQTEIIEQAADDSIDNREPVTYRQIIAQIISVAIAVGLYKGVIEPGEGAILGAQSEVIVGSIITVGAILGAIAGRMKASSPKTAAGVAITNAVLPESSTPTLTVNPRVVEAAVLSVK
jgi:hypothetical protein